MIIHCEAQVPSSQIEDLIVATPSMSSIVTIIDTITYSVPSFGLSLLHRQPKNESESITQLRQPKTYFKSTT